MGTWFLGKGWKAARNTGHLRCVVGGVANIIAQMAQGAREQAASLKEVTTAAAQSLSGETEQLAGLVDGFRTKVAGGKASVAPAQTIARALAVPNRSATAVTQSRTTSRGGAAPKAAAAAQQESWEER